MNKTTVNRCVAALAYLGFCANAFSGVPENSAGKLILPHTLQESISSEQVVTIVPDGVVIEGSAQLQASKAQNSTIVWQEVPGQTVAGAFTDRPVDRYRFYRVQQSSSNALKLRISATPPDYRTNLTLTFPALSGWSHQLEIKTGLDWTVLLPALPTNSPVNLSEKVNANAIRVAAVPTIVREAFETILIGGQSNAEYSDDPYYPNREEAVMYLDRSLGFRHPSKFHQGLASSPFTYSFSTAAAADLASTTSSPFLLIPTAVGGTSMEQWMPGSDRFDRSTLFGDANFRRVVGSPQGVRAIWYYGHGSSTAPADIHKYPDDWKTLIAEFRQSAGDVPVIYAQLSKSTDLNMNANNFAGAEHQRLAEGGQPGGIPQTDLVVTFDLPLGDAIHLNGAAQKELGRRFALAMRQHVYGEAINGTGPRLKSVQFADSTKRVIEILFDRRINTPVDDYDHQFAVRSQNGLVPISLVTRSSGQTAVLVELEEAPAGPITLSYGGTQAVQTGVWLTNVVRDLSGLPAPSFGPVPVR